MKDFLKKLWERFVKILETEWFPFGMAFFSLGMVFGSLKNGSWCFGWRELYSLFIAILWFIIFMQNKYIHDKGRADEQ